MRDIVKIIYEDEHLIAVSKPCEVLTHYSAMDKKSSNICSLLREHCGYPVYPLHRLDRATSGLLVFAKNGHMASLMSSAFRARNVKKYYFALVRGRFQERSDKPYLPLVIDKPLRSLSHTDNRLQEARTQLYVMGETALGDERFAKNHGIRTTRYSFCLVCPESGRQHQIRRHLKSLHHPIIGDSRYGKGDQNGFFRTYFKVRRLMLHSYGLSFVHPLKREVTTITCRVSEEFEDLLRRLKLSHVQSLVDDLILSQGVE